MLHEFLETNRDELVKRCRAKVAERPGPAPAPIELEYGIPPFIDQLVATLRAELAPGATLDQALAEDIGATARRHGQELLRKGFTIDQVVHDYGDLCQALTELAHEQRAPITVDEFHTFNRCLDNAMADAVTAFGRRRDQAISQEGVQTMNERLGILAHELRNKANTAMLALHTIKTGNVAVGGATGAVLDRSLIELTHLIDRALADVRLTAGLEARRERLALGELLAEVSVVAVMDAKTRGVVFATAIDLDLDVVVDADRQMLSSAIANLVQNALKFTARGGHVLLRAHAVAAHVLIEVEDECGGLPPGAVEELFKPFAQRGVDRSGVGLGLSISRRGVEASGGTLVVRDVPGTECVFTIDLPPASVA